MKYNFFTQRNLFVAFCAMALAFTGCIKEEMGDCKYYALRLKVENTKGGDITESGIVSEATLFIFDENNKFLDKVLLDDKAIKSRKSIELDYPSSAKLNVVAWAGLAGERQNVTDAKLISDLEVNLKKDGTIASSPDSLYYGIKTNVITRSSEGQTINQEIVIRKKIGSVQVRTVGIEYARVPASKAGNGTVSPDDFSYIVDRTPSGFDYQGNMIGDSVSYSPAPFINETGYLETDKANVIPADNISASLMSKGTQIYNVSKNDKGESFNVGVDENLLIVVQLGEDGNVLSVKSSVRAWGDTDQEEEL